MSYYFKILFLSISIPFFLSFDKRVKFYQKFRILLFSIPTSSIVFILWDIFFAYNNVWGFNDKYISGLSFIYLPIEEILFFFIIPFCCLFTYFILKKYNVVFFSWSGWSTFHITLSFVFLFIAYINFSKIYTFICLFFLSMILLIISFYKHKVNYNLFYTNFTLMLIPFTIVNGALTGSFLGQTVVWYNASEILNVYFATIPIEDVAYCFLLILINVIFYEYFDSKDRNQYIF